MADSANVGGTCFDVVMEPETSALDASHADVRVEFGMARAELAAQTVTQAFAAQLAAVHATLREARAYPEVFLGSALHASHPDAVEFAERAAIADLAVRLCVAEQTIRAQDHQAHMLLFRAP